MALCLGSPTSDKAVWGHSPDKPVWRDVIPDETEVAPGRDWPSNDICKTRRFGGDRDRPYIGPKSASRQFPHGCLFLSAGRSRPVGIRRPEPRPDVTSCCGDAVAACRTCQVGPDRPQDGGSTDDCNDASGNRRNSGNANGPGRQGDCLSPGLRRWRGLDPQSMCPDVLDDGRGAGSEALTWRVFGVNWIRAERAGLGLEARLATSKSDVPRLSARPER